MIGPAPSPSLPPTPEDAQDQRRWEHTRALYRMLYGLWRGDLKQKITSMVGSERASAWGNFDQASNVALGSCTALATQYDRGVEVECGSTEGYDDPNALIDEIANTGLWSLKQRYQRDLIGMREMLMSIDIVDGRIVYRRVTPDYVVAKSHPRDPSRPTTIREAREIEKIGGTRWVWDEWTETGLRVVEADGAKGLIEERPPWVYSDGRPFLPYVLDHAAVTGMLWDPYASIELFSGALMAAVFCSFFGHGYLDASWPQRWLLGCEPLGVGVEGDALGKRRAVVTDPSVAVMLTMLADFVGQPQVGQWVPGCDITLLWDACAQYTRAVAASAGIAPSDIQRIAGDPRSGMSLAITREAQREAQRRFAPILRPGDEELLAKTAAMVNRWNASAIAEGRPPMAGCPGTNYPEIGYRVVYGAIPPSAEEVAEGRAQSDWEQENGLASPITIYRRLHPGTDAKDASKAIIAVRLEAMALDAEIDAQAKALGISKAPPVPPPAPPIPPRGET